MRRIVHVCHNHVTAKQEAIRMQAALTDSELRMAEFSVQTEDETHLYVSRFEPHERFMGMLIDDIVWHVHIGDTPWALYECLVSRCGRS